MSSVYTCSFLIPSSTKAIISPGFLSDFSVISPHLDPHEFTFKLWIHHEPWSIPSSSDGWDGFLGFAGRDVISGIPGYQFRPLVKKVNQLESSNGKPAEAEVKNITFICTMDHHVVYVHDHS